jgi:hypothetical protein
MIYCSVIQFHGTEDFSLQTSFFIDETTRRLG